MKRPRGFTSVLGFLIALALCHLFVSLRVGGLHEALLFYPAQGEDQAGKNLTRLLFVVFPAAVLAGFALAHAVGRRVGPRGARTALAVAVCLVAALSYLALRADAGGAGGVVFTSTFVGIESSMAAGLWTLASRLLRRAR